MNNKTEALRRGAAALTGALCDGCTRQEREKGGDATAGRLEIMRTSSKAALRVATIEMRLQSLQELYTRELVSVVPRTALPRDTVSPRRGQHSGDRERRRCCTALFRAYWRWHHFLMCCPPLPQTPLSTRASLISSTSAGKPAKHSCFTSLPVSTLNTILNTTSSHIRAQPAAFPPRISVSSWAQSSIMGHRPSHASCCIEVPKKLQASHTPHATRPGLHSSRKPPTFLQGFSITSSLKSSYRYILNETLSQMLRRLFPRIIPRIKRGR